MDRGRAAGALLRLLASIVGLFAEGILLPSLTKDWIFVACLGVARQCSREVPSSPILVIEDLDKDRAGCAALTNRDEMLKSSHPSD
jgi:hypothetical protein